MKFILCFVAVFFVLGAVGCAHQPKVPMPGADAGPIMWKDYYKDQFKAYGDKVVPPPADAPQAQRIAYDDAKHTFHHQKVIGMIVSGCLLLISVSLLLSTLSEL
jgi:hypothetical protein